MLVFTSSARAAGSVQLELVGDTQGAAMLYQEWSQALGKAGIRNFHIGSVNEDARPGIDVQGTETNPIYVVTGLIHSRDELILPGKKFRRTELAKLAEWLKDLAERGPNAEKEPKTPFGLKREDLEKICKDLVTPVAFSTEGMSRKTAVEKISDRLKLPVKLDPDAAQELEKSQVEDDLSELSCGTALACLLRPVGYAMTPTSTGGETAYAIVKARPDLDVWSVGMEAEKPPIDQLPEFYEKRNVNIDNVTADVAIDAIAKRVKVVVLLDHLALNRHNIDPAKAKVSHPNSRTTYNRALNKILFQAKLKHEIRFDDAGKPFLWITTQKPVQ